MEPELVDEVGDAVAAVGYALEQVVQDVAAVDAELGPLYDRGTVTEWVPILTALMGLRKRIQELESLAETNVVRAMPGKTADVGEVTVTKHRNVKTVWDHERMSQRVVDKAMTDCHGDLDEAVWLARDYLLQAGSVSYWRTGVLDRLGLKYDDLRDREFGRQIVRIDPKKIDETS